MVELNSFTFLSDKTVNLQSKTFNCGMFCQTFNRVKTFSLLTCYIFSQPGSVLIKKGNAIMIIFWSVYLGYYWNWKSLLCLKKVLIL